MLEFQVNKQNFTQTRVVEHESLNEDSALAAGEILVQIENFALTANNITYAAMGDQLGYWQFFPPADNAENKWGIIPVWGFAKVISSNNKDIAIGEKLFGYFPPSSLLKMKAGGISSQRFIDESEHRSKLPPGYNVYRRVSAEPGYNSAYDYQRMMLFPLHITSFCIWDYLKDMAWFGAEQVVIVSASSKTSIGLAYGLKQDDKAPEVIGLTSTRNVDFVNGLALYDQTINYDHVNEIDTQKKTVIVDMSGNAELLKSIEDLCGGNLTYCIQVGLTHWDEAQAEPPLKHTKSEMFFAPGQIQKKIQQVGAKAFEQESLGFMASTAQQCAAWLNFSLVKGLHEMPDIYHDVCTGKLPPDQGIIIAP